ncbi:hypothetical protein FACS1894120_2820 [Clostridia bacterium]|nr:hypothetical protein FACS1894120_2820 [Clostridia bacterium]
MTDFARQVYDTLLKIPRGKVVSYSQLALLCGKPFACRAVGNILHNNPMPVVVPCHRVVNAQGNLAVKFGFGGAEEQRRLLEEENVGFDEKGRVRRDFFLNADYFLSADFECAYE